MAPRNANNWFAGVAQEAEAQQAQRDAAAAADAAQVDGAPASPSAVVDLKRTALPLEDTPDAYSGLQGGVPINHWQPSPPRPHWLIDSVNSG